MKFLPICLLFISNIFMSFAWYGHLKNTKSALIFAILSSWGIAFFEYCFSIPANRIGAQYFTVAQLKIIQEVITLIVFSGFSVLYLKQEFRLNYIYAFLCMIGAVYFMFKNNFIKLLYKLHLKFLIKKISVVCIFYINISKIIAKVSIKKIIKI